jgi:hypothetical protein
MSKRLFIILLFFMTLFRAESALSLPRQPQFSAQVDKTEIHLGDLVHLKLEVSHPPKTELLWPVWESSLGEWAFRKKTAIPPSLDADGWIREGIDLEVTAYRLGDLEIPTINATLRQGDGTTLQMQSNPVRIKITSVISGKDQELREIKPQAELPEDYRWLWILLASLVLLGVAGFFAHRYFKTKKKKNIINPEMLLSPEEAARLAIRELEARDLIGKGRFKEYYFELSEIIKRYLGRRLKIPSLERTTREFALDMERSQLLWDQRQVVRKFLEECDLVKFARYVPSLAEIDAIRQGATGIIATTEKLFTEGSASLVEAKK